MEDIQDIMQEFADEFGGYAEADQDDQRFVIDNDSKAEWAMRKIAEEEAEFERLDACCQEQIDRYTEKQVYYAKRLESRTANLRAMLLEYFCTVPVKETKTQQKYELPSGSLVLKKAISDFKPDNDKLRDWLEAAKMTKYLKTEVSPKWAMVKKQLEISAFGEIVFKETGEVLPEGCVTVETKPERFEVKAK